MLHQALLWLAHFDMCLWPFAMEYGVCIFNNLPDGQFNVDGGLCTIYIYAASKTDSDRMRQEKTWGCPAYVLDLRLQDGKKIRKGPYE